MKQKSLCLLMAAVILLSVISITPPAARAVSDMKITEDCLTFLKDWEGFHPKPYWDSSQWTVGYGTKCPEEHRARYDAEGITEEEALTLLMKEIAFFEAEVNYFLDVNNLTYTQNEFDAIVSLVFNCGASWLTKGETLLGAITKDVSDNELIFALTIYSMSGGNRSKGHIKRRLTECNIYLNGIYSLSVPDNYRYVLYDACGGELDEYDVQGFDANQPTELFATATYEGYKFLGWFTEETGGTKVDVLNDTIPAGKWLYAHWEPLTPAGTTPTQPTVPPTTKPTTPPTTQPTEPPTQPTQHTHSYTQKVYKPTCTAEGYTIYTCTSCGVQEKKDIVPAKGHSYSKTVTEPTCTKPGYSRYTCQTCGHSYTAEETAARGHDYAHEVIEPTCTLGGKTNHTCKRCGHKYTDQTTPALEHNYNRVVVSPTCTENGYTTYACTRCQHSYNGDYTPAAGHTWGAWTVTKEPTYTETGLRQRKCTACGEIQRQTVEPIQHTHSYTQKVYKPTCTAEGYTIYTCSDCGVQEKKDIVPAKGHSYSKTVTEPTCTGTGYSRYTCQTCGHSYTAEETAARGHDYAHDVIKPTCTLGGKTNHTCKRCGHKYTDQTTSALGHNYNRVVVAPTCTEKGYTAYECTRCQHGYHEDCTAATGHTWSAWTVTKEPTYTEAGMQQRKCTACGEIQQQAVPQLTTPPTTPPTEPPVTTPEPGSGTVVTVTGVEVYIRTGPGTGYSILGFADKGQKITVTATASAQGYLWGKFSGGWICLNFTDYEEVKENASKPMTGGTVITIGTLNIRENAGTAYNVVGEYNSGDRVEIYEIKAVGAVDWGRTDKGWISLDYVRLDDKEEPGTNDDPTVPSIPTIPPIYTSWTGTVVVSDALYVRSGPSSENAIVTFLQNGTKVTILEETLNGAVRWGRIQQGWVCLDYIRPDQPTGNDPTEPTTPPTQPTDPSTQPTQPTEPSTQPTVPSIQPTEPSQPIKPGTYPIMTVNTTSLRVRSDAGITNKIKDFFGFGERIEILEVKAVGSAQWGRTVIGWVDMRYLK